MINRQTLLTDLQRLLQRLEADLLERSESTEIVRVGEVLRQEYEQAKAAARTAQNYEDWRSDTITQHAAAWVLSCVFVRFLEDNRLLDPPRISGQRSAVSDQQSADGCSRLQLARDEQELYFRSNPRQTDRDYLLAVFDQLKELPATADVFGDHNPLRQLPDWLSGDAAGELLRFFQKINADDGLLIHDFTDPEWNTRFLGDLYQDLSEAARKKYALLQTPDFVEAFILDRTLEPALDEFGLNPGREGEAPAEPVQSDGSAGASPSRFKLIDPACGSGHFLLGSFPRILNRWMKQEPGTNLRVLVQRTLDSIHGVDVNPFATAIARFRLLLVAMRACGVQRLADAPAFRLHLACGDSLYHGRQRQQVLDADWQDEAHYFRSEDTAELRRILREGTYHAVVANPPYITPKDAAANRAYRQLYPRSCHMKYSLSVPFMERLLALAVRGTTATASTARAQGRNLFDAEESSDSPQPTSPGYVGQITANSFMKREFGRKLIEDYFPTVDLTHVIDTSGAYIPGHGTPTVILFGRNRQPLQPTIRTVLGIRGEPSTPDNPAEGRVWTAILQSIDHPSRAATVRERTPMETHGGVESASSRARLENAAQFVSAGDSQRELFLKHPWSIGGGGASELKEQLERGAAARLDTHADSIGITAFTLEDDIFVLPAVCAYRKSMAASDLREMVAGDELRDWQQPKCESVVFPYTADFEPVEDDPDSPALRYLWMARTCLANNKMFAGVTKVQSGLRWYEYGRLTSSKLRTPLSITFAEIATHNHFVLDRGGKVFKQTAPVIKLAADATEDQHLALLGLLNSSTACFWMKQVSHNKGSTVDQHGARQRTAPFEDFYAFNGTKVGQFPLPHAISSHFPDLEAAACSDGSPAPTGEIATVLRLAEDIDRLATELRDVTPSQLLVQSLVASGETGANLAHRVKSLRARFDDTLSRMIFLQEELDWACYALYGLSEVAPAPPPQPSRARQEADTPKTSRARQEADTTAAQEHHSLTVAARQDAQQVAQHVVARRRSSNEIEPQVYFITFTCYGTWLHGDPRGSVDREHNLWQTPRLEPDEQREQEEFLLLKHAPVILGARQRSLVHDAIVDVCTHRGWHLHAINIRTNHVHLVVTADRTGKRVLNDVKSYATRKLKQENCLPDACMERFADTSRAREEADTPEIRVWTRGGSARPVTTENSLHAAIDYTLNRQGPDITQPGPAPSSRAREEADTLEVGEDRSLTVAARPVVARQGANDVLPLRRGQRAFEIVLARQIAAGTAQSTWFERHGSTPITEIPADWPPWYCQIVRQRIDRIEADTNIRLMEQPEYKRRWNTEPWEDQFQRSLQDWLLNRLESYFDFDGRMQPSDSAQRPSAPLADIGLHSLARLASVAGSDAEFHEVATVYRDDPAFDVLALVTELVQPESVPLLPVLRYKDSGLRKRSEWEQTWDLQRKEDEEAISYQRSAISGEANSFQRSAVSESQGVDSRDLIAEPPELKADSRPLTAESFSITVPPKYVSADFLSGDFWRLRGKLDVPKERWISFPHCDAADGTLMLCWAGYNHLQQAQAISGHYAEIEEREGGGADPRLPPLLACLLELLPWLKQWHNDVDPTYGVAMGDYFEGFVNEEARKLGLTLQDLRNWKPPAKPRGRARRGAGR